MAETLESWMFATYATWAMGSMATSSEPQTVGARAGGVAAGGVDGLAVRAVDRCDVAGELAVGEQGGVHGVRGLVDGELERIGAGLDDAKGEPAAGVVRDAESRTVEDGDGGATTAAAFGAGRIDRVGRRVDYDAHEPATAVR